MSSCRACSIDDRSRDDHNEVMVQGDAYDTVEPKASDPADGRKASGFPMCARALELEDGGGALPREASGQPEASSLTHGARGLRLFRSLLFVQGCSPGSLPAAIV